MSDAKAIIAARAAKELRAGEVVNLGIGLPAMIPDYVDSAVGVVLQSENGVLGVGPRPSPDELDVELVDASKLPITIRPGASFFDSAASFAMIRGGHVDAVVLGALQVAGNGDIANWMIPGGKTLGVGGAMDLVVGARRVIVTMTARSPSGEPKIVERCTLPLTARGVVGTIITEHAVFRIDNGTLALTELLDGATLEIVRAETGCGFADALDMPAG